MAEEQDDSQKTEEPTQKRLDESRQKGQVASSKEINHWFMILGGTLFVIMLAPGTLRGIEAAMVRFIEAPHTMTVESSGFSTAITTALGDVGLALLMPLGILMVLALASGFVQHGFLFSAEQIMPKLDKISPMAGFQRLFSMKALVDCNKALTATDFRPELAKLSVPTLIVHGDQDISAPLAITGRKTAALLPHATVKIYEGAPHGLFLTHAQRLNKDLQEFVAT